MVRVASPALASSAVPVDLRLVGGGGQATAAFVYDGNRVKSTIVGVTTVYLGSYYEWNGSAGIKYYYAGLERVVMLDAAGTLYFLLGDHLGSTSKVANSTGMFVSELRYDPWGVTPYTNGTTPTNFHYIGQRKETGIGGLYFYGARWYDRRGALLERGHRRAGGGEPAGAQSIQLRGQLRRLPALRRARPGRLPTARAAPPHPLLLCARRVYDRRRPVGGHLGNL
jgi:hypothetical protein